VTGEPLHARRTLLEELMDGIPGTSLLALGMHTDDVETARLWFESLHRWESRALSRSPQIPRTGREIVRRGTRSSILPTTEAIVGGVIGGLAAPTELILGRTPLIQANSS